MINPALHDSPQHLKLIGSMVIGYGDLEITFAHIAGLVLGLRYEVLNATSRVYSETGKIKLINSLAKGAFDTAGLGEEFRTTHNMMFYCAEIRNRYAHCHWRRNSKQHPLQFVIGDDLFQPGTTADSFPWKSVTLPLLREQEAYFEGTRKWLLYLEKTLVHRNRRHPVSWTKPPTLPKPPAHNSDGLEKSPHIRRITGLQ